MSEIKSIKIADGSEISYRFDGDKSKPVIVFVNGSIFNFKQFDPVLFPALKKRLKDNYSYLFYDYVGIGKSSPLEGEFDFLKLTQQHIELLDALGIDKAHHFGFSKGSLVSFIVAARNPERVISLAGYGNHYLGLNDEKVRLKYSKKRQALSSISGIWDQRVNEFNYGILYDAVFLSTVFPDKTLKTLSLTEKAKNKVIKNKLKPMLWDTPIEIIDKLYKYYTTSASEEEMNTYIEAMEKINIPSLLLHGTDDTTVKISSSEALNKLIKTSKFIRFDGFSHTEPVLIKKKGNKIMSAYADFLISLSN